jgi:hypothetical protein
MRIAGPFIAALQREQRLGNVSSETEQHLKHEFRRLGQDATPAMLADAVRAEIDRLDRQAATLRRLREGLLGDTQIDGGPMTDGQVVTTAKWEVS